MITINELYKNYGRHEVLKGINVEVAAGEIYGFIGHNGAGKSTTMSILVGLMDFQRGQCFVNGKQVSKGHTALFREVGYLPEEPKFYPYMSAREYLDFLGNMGGMSLAACKKRTAELLELVHLESASKRAIGGYSRGMRQRLGMATALYHDPKTLLLDEPSSALDPEGRKDVVDIIGALKNQGKTIFLSTHILGDVEKVCGRIGILHGGKIVVEGNLDQILEASTKPVYEVDWEYGPAPGIIHEIKRADFIKAVSLEGETLVITVGDPSRDGEKLLRLLAPLSTGIRRIQMRRATLEDIYLKVVKRDV